MSHHRKHTRASSGAGLALLLAVTFCLTFVCAAAPVRANTAGSVQDYTDQAVPAPMPPVSYNSPLAAGTLTLQDVLEAHKVPDAAMPAAVGIVAPAKAPILTPPQQSSSTNLMMEQGLRSVLQTTGDLSVVVPSPHAKKPVAQAAPAALSTQTPAGQTSAVAPVAYLPGQEPKNLATGKVVTPATPETPPASSVSEVSTPSAASASAQSCDAHTQKWEKSCVEAGYPASFAGKVVGETRVGCADGALHDFWVSNSCAPASETSAASGIQQPSMPDREAVCEPVAVKNNVSEITKSTEVKTEQKPVMRAMPSPKMAGPTATKDEFCGTATEILAYEAPTKDLCRVGTPGSVSGDGPWTWSCTDNDGLTSSCRTLSLSGDTASEVPAAAMPAVPAAAPVATVAKSETLPASTPFGIGTSVAGSHKEVVVPVCGAAAKTATMQKPDQDLCDVGSASAVRGAGPWHWTCAAGKRKLACQSAKATDAACGPANGMVAQSAPFVGLCAAGTPTSVSGNGPWTWSCSGTGGGTSVACGATAPNHDAAVETPAAPQPVAVDPAASVPVPVVTPNPVPAHVFPSAPKVSAVPSPMPAAAAESLAVPTPHLSADSQPVTPPAVKDTLAPAPVLQESDVTPKVYAGHVSLDPTISTILFSRGQGTIDPQVVTTLDKLAAVLTANADVRITLIAYADSDNTTPPRDARRLSLNRALAVRDYLAGKGIANSRVDIRAEGVNAASGYPDRVDIKVNE